MKVIVYINDPKEMGHAQRVLQSVLEDAELGTCGFIHEDGTASSYERRKSGTVVIRVQAKVAA